VSVLLKFDRLIELLKKVFKCGRAVRSSIVDAYESTKLSGYSIEELSDGTLKLEINYDVCICRLVDGMLKPCNNKSSKCEFHIDKVNQFVEASVSYEIYREYKNAKSENEKNLATRNANSMFRMLGAVMPGKIFSIELKLLNSVAFPHLAKEEEDGYW
jgi:hypothetical protein